MSAKRAKHAKHSTLQSLQKRTGTVLWPQDARKKQDEAGVGIFSASCLEDRFHRSLLPEKKKVAQQRRTIGRAPRHEKKANAHFPDNMH